MKYLIQLIIFYSLFTTILFAQKPFVLETDLLETIPPENLTFLQGVDHGVASKMNTVRKFLGTLIPSKISSFLIYQKWFWLRKKDALDGHAQCV